jgi:pimeloyl-ACP methyl ester carboxylesterase
MKRLSMLFCLIPLMGCVASPMTAVVPTTRPAVVPVTVTEIPRPTLPPYLLHLPGIGGTRSHDRAMIRGLQQAGFTGETQIYDWTGEDTGLKALLDSDRDRQQARAVADMIAKRFDANPKERIILTSHSGGGGIAVWALEDLPDRVKIETLLLVAPALSPGYDLSKALSHVTGHAYVFCSLEDPVLGLGTRTFGTIDGVKTDAGGRVGFTRPAHAEIAQYDKLEQFPYDPDWMRLNNYGDHVGAMARKFSQVILEPLIMTGKLPGIQPTTSMGNHL